MQVHQIRDLSNIGVIDILKKGLSNVDAYPLNYSPEHSDNNANIFYLLKHGRYEIGNYFVVEEAGEYVASAGWSEYESDTALILTRAYVSKPYRASYVMAEKILPTILEQCAEYPKVWITCNMGNSSIYKWFLRNSEGKTSGMFNNWPDIYKQFEPIGVRTVNYTEQYIAQLKR